jgi:hypothetical protein
VKFIESVAGIGCWKKQMPYCNDMDIGLNIDCHENEQTSSRSFFVRKYVELELK